MNLQLCFINNSESEEEEEEEEKAGESSKKENGSTQVTILTSALTGAVCKILVNISISKGSRILTNMGIYEYFSKCNIFQGDLKDILVTITDNNIYFCMHMYMYCIFVFIHVYIYIFSYTFFFFFTFLTKYKTA